MYPVILTTIKWPPGVSALDVSKFGSLDIHVPSGVTKQGKLYKKNYY